MKQTVIGTGIFLCGVIVLCTNCAMERILEAMPNVTVVSGGIPVGWAACLLMLVGALLIWRGCRQDRKRP